MPGSLAVSLGTHIKHEQRAVNSGSSWKRSLRVEPEAIIPLRVGLVQTNLYDIGPSHLDAIADPRSDRYGQHLSVDEVHSLFAPDGPTVDAVRTWMVESGVDHDDIIHSENKGWLAVDLPAAIFEKLFRTSIHEYENSKSGELRLGCEEYHLPGHLVEHIDYITPGVKLSAAVKKRDAPQQRRALIEASSSLKGQDVDSLSAAQAALPRNLRHCAETVSPDCIRALYDIPSETHCDQANAPGFFEQGDYYSQEDLNGFFNQFAPSIPNGTEPEIVLIDGAKDPLPSTSKQVTGEADGDLEIAFGLLYPTVPIVYQVDDPYYARHELKTFNLFNTFLDALDGSYCNYTAFGITGDSWRDPVYPDPHKGGYKGQLQCGTVTPAKVISISYGEAEADIPIRYNKRQCNEWMKLTILTASGDYGVAGFPGDDSANGCLKAAGSHGKNGTVFNPDYLSSCPYITSVGGTEIPEGNTVNEPETAWPNVFNASFPYSSSGGFSNLFPRPSWQQSAVDQWLANHDPGYPSYVANANLSNIGQDGGLYNSAGRGFPDVSANAARIGVVVGGAEHGGYGTSYASPIWASVISLINQNRTLAGKGPVGFINPVLYAHTSALHDIEGGTNPGCNTDGFAAVQGWDPITGLGTPNFPELMEVFMALP